MKIITDPQITRQIKPVDFSFLSSADQEITLAVETMLRTMYGFQDNIPIILQGLTYTIPQHSQQSPTISAGKVLLNGIVYDIEQLSLALSNTITANNILSHVSLLLQKRVIAPSPVLDKDLNETINCHYEYYGTLTQATVNLDNYNDLSLPNTSSTSPRQLDNQTLSNYLGVYPFSNLVRVESIAEISYRQTSLQLQELNQTLATINTSITQLRRLLSSETSTRADEVDKLKYILRAIINGETDLYLETLWEHLFSVDDWNDHRNYNDFINNNSDDNQ